MNKKLVKKLENKLNTVQAKAKTRCYDLNEAVDDINRYIANIKKGKVVEGESYIVLSYYFERFPKAYKYTPNGTVLCVRVNENGTVIDVDAVRGNVDETYNTFVATVDGGAYYRTNYGHTDDNITKRNWNVDFNIFKKWDFEI